MSEAQTPEVHIPTGEESAAVPVLPPELPAHGHAAAQVENPEHESPFAGQLQVEGDDDDDDDEDGDFDEEEDFDEEDEIEGDHDQETIDNAEREASE